MHAPKTDSGDPMARPTGGTPADIRCFLEEQKARFAEQAARLAHVFRRTADSIDGEDREAGRYARWVSDQAERMSKFLRQRQLDDLTEKARRLATRKNLLLVGGAAAAGFLCYYLLKRRGTESAQGVETVERAEEAGS